MSETPSHSRPVAVLGATGYVGGRLVPRLLQAGIRVRGLARSERKLRCRPWGGHPDLEFAKVDVMDAESLAKGLEGCRAAYYLVHSMRAGPGDFADLDRRAAQNMADGSARAGLSQIIYLGGLGQEGEGLSHHLKSRIETGRVLASGPVPLTWLKAAMLLGSGSASFELMRYLVERLPVMTTPRWVSTLCQPIAVSNVLTYLMGCLDNPKAMGREFDIGGPDILSYRDLFRIYAQEAGLPRRLIIPVPVLSPRLSSYWIHLVTPVPAGLARPLAEGLRNKVVCRENHIHEVVPQTLLTCREAIQKALQTIEQQRVETCFSDAGELIPPEWLACGDAPYAGGTVLECSRKMALACDPETVWKTLERVGGDAGWYYADFLWRVRGLVDRLIGGVGLRRTRRDRSELRVGDAVGFWRVLTVEPPRRIQLLAEMKLPGQAILQFQVEPQGEGKSELRLISRFLPRGLFGLVYWWAFYPVHGPLFSGMLRRMAKMTGCAALSPPAPFKSTADMCRL